MDAATPFDAFRAHDHGQCRDAARAEAEALCRQRGLRMTPARAHVLDMLLEGHRAMTAYELLEGLRQAGLGSQPPVIYRALGFLTEHGFVHRIERLNAYVACTRGPDGHRAAFLICRVCRRVAEMDAAALDPALRATALRAGFRIERAALEMEGLCPACAATDPDAPRGAGPGAAGAAGPGRNR